MAVGYYAMKTNTKFLSCDWLEHGIIFDHENILRVCCSQCNEGGGRPVLWGDYHGELIDWNRLFALKKEMRDVQRTGDTYYKCKGCILLKEDEWDDDNYINRLLLTHWINCNCKCIYCPAVSDSYLKTHNKHYNIVPVLEDMCNKNILRKDAFISIAGGESTIYPEFEGMLHLLLDYGCNNILLNSSGIKYSSAVAKGLAENKLNLTVSIDSGTREMYQTLKVVKTYDLVCRNLTKYAEAQGKNDFRVCSKFIIVPGYNDNPVEIESWLINTKNQGIKQVSIDVDWRWVQKNMNRLEQERRIYDLITFVKSIADKEDLYLRYDERASIMRKIHKIDKAVFGGTIQKIKR